MSKQDNGPGKVHQFPCDKAIKIEPPKMWALKLVIDHGRSQAVYFQKADAITPLVRIVDVLADFADRHGLPAGAAIDEFLAAVDSSLLDAIYTLNENHFASLLDAGHMYGFDTQAVAEAQSMRLYGVKEASRGLYPWAASPLEALKRHIQEHGPQRSAHSLYAVSHSTANRLWGWGEMAPNLLGKVSAALDDWEKWQAAAAAGGYLDIYQVLAVLLWWRTNQQKLSQSEEGVFVNHWAAKIKAATPMRAATLGVCGPFRQVTPLDPITRLPIAGVQSINSLEGWVFSWANIDAWLESLGFERLYTYFFGCSEKEELALDTKPICTWRDAADLHKHQSDDGKKPAWTHQKLAPIAAALKSGVSPKEIASAAGIKRQTLEEVVKKYEANPVAYGAPLPTPSNDADKSSAGAALHDVWSSLRTR